MRVDWKQFWLFTLACFVAGGVTVPLELPLWFASYIGAGLGIFWPRRIFSFK